MKNRIKTLLKSVFISAVFIMIVGFGFTWKQYRLDYVDVINECFEGGYDEQMIRDKVIMGNQEYLFYGREDIGYGYIKLRKGMNNKFKILRNDKTSQYFQVINPVVDSQMYNIIIGHNPTESSISCEIDFGFIHNDISSGDFVLIYKPTKYTTINKDALIFRNDSGIDITDMVIGL